MQFLCAFLRWAMDAGVTSQSPQETKRSARRDEAGGESFEDAESDADWVEGLSLVETESFLDNSTYICTNVVGMGELMEKFGSLERKLKDSEENLHQVKSENEKLTSQ